MIIMSRTGPFMGVRIEIAKWWAEVSGWYAYMRDTYPPYLDWGWIHPVNTYLTYPKPSQTLRYIRYGEKIPAPCAPVGAPCRGGAPGIFFWI